MNHRELLIDFFLFFRDYGEEMIGLSIEDFVDLYLEWRSGGIYATK